MREGPRSGSNERGQEGTPSVKSERKVIESSRKGRRRAEVASEGFIIRRRVVGTGHRTYSVKERNRILTSGSGLDSVHKVTVGKAGRVTLPASVRDELELHEGVELIVQVEAGELVLTPVVTVPRSYRWAYSREHSGRLNEALADAEEGRIRPLDEDELTQVLRS